MPLVKTPMIAPSRKLNPTPAITADHAAAMVVRGLVDKPTRIDTPVGTLAEAGHYFAPGLSRRIMHQLYLGYPDSPAARGVSTPTEHQPARRPRRPVRGLGPGLVNLRTPGPIKWAVRLVPGVHW
jgi:hypothetical protein